jgi:hypothetical protein
MTENETEPGPEPTQPEILERSLTAGLISDAATVLAPVAAVYVGHKLAQGDAPKDAPPPPQEPPQQADKAESS